MEKPIFDILVEISRKDFVDFKDISGKSNRNQRLDEEEKYRKLNYLENYGFVSRTKDIYTITEYGFIVAQYENWTEYLAHRQELMNKKIAKENNDLKISEFQVRTTYLPYFLSVISIILSIIVFFYSIRKDNNDSVRTKKDTTITIQTKQNKPNAILPKKAIDSSKPKNLRKP